MAPPRHSRFAWWPLRVVDCVTEALTVPLTHSLSLAVSCYTLTTHDDVSTHMMFMRFAIIGPLLFIFSFLAFLPALIGWLIWIALNTYTSDIQPFTYRAPDHPRNHPRGSQTHPPVSQACGDVKLSKHVSQRTPGNGRMMDEVSDGWMPAVSLSSAPKGRSHPFRVTLSSTNVLLAPEVVARFNNCPNTSWRVKEMTARMLRQNRDLNHPNLAPPVQREQVVVSQFPEVDIFLLQEVVERRAGRGVVAALQNTYPYCVFDVGTHSRHTNLFMCGSGLFLASKFPILDCHFHPYSSYSHYGCVVGLGVLLAKLDLGVVVKGGRAMRAVGYVANTHTQAYQGEKNIVSRQLTEADTVYTQYIHQTHDTHTETLMFAVFGGDFNVDNMSQGDHEPQNLPLWNNYTDPCRVGPGQDQAWAVGTEHRQKQLHHPALKHPSSFRDILLDDVLRRHFILDADVKVHTLDLMRVPPRPGSDGQVRATPWGGRRRIDYLLLRKDGRTRPASYWFTSAFAGLTDHVPVAMMLEEEEEEEEEVVEEEEVEEVQEKVQEEVLRLRSNEGKGVSEEIEKDASESEVTEEDKKGV